MTHRSPIMHAVVCIFLASAALVLQGCGSGYGGSRGDAKQSSNSRTGRYDSSSSNLRIRDAEWCSKIDSFLANSTQYASEYEANRVESLGLKSAGTRFCMARSPLKHINETYPEARQGGPDGSATWAIGFNDIHEVFFELMAKVVKNTARVQARMANATEAYRQLVEEIMSNSTAGVKSDMILKIEEEKSLCNQPPLSRVNQTDIETAFDMMLNNYTSSASVTPYYFEELDTVIDDIMFVFNETRPYLVPYPPFLAVLDDHIAAMSLAKTNLNGTGNISSYPDCQNY